ncbi:MAG: hypothetical protein ACM3OH_06240 [Bacillota bacterium]
MTGGLLGAAALLAFLLWSFQRARAARRQPRDLGEIDHEELEAAERDVRDLGTAADQDEGFTGDDWGPGAGSPPPSRDK